MLNWALVRRRAIYLHDWLTQIEHMLTLWFLITSIGWSKLLSDIWLWTKKNDLKFRTQCPLASINSNNFDEDFINKVVISIQNILKIAWKTDTPLTIFQLKVSSCILASIFYHSWTASIDSMCLFCSRNWQERCKINSSRMITATLTNNRWRR